MFPGFDHAVVPTPVKLAPVPALFGPLICPGVPSQEEVTVKDPEPPAQIAALVVERTEFTVTTLVAVALAQPPVPVTV